MRGKVRLTRSTRGEFDLNVGVMSLNYLTEEDIDWINDFQGDDAEEQARNWCAKEGYQIIEPEAEIGGSVPLMQLLHEVLREALDIGSSNWDSYLAPNRWPELEDSEKYKELVARVKELAPG